MRIQLKANNAGRLISRGRGGHISRIIRNWELIFVLKSRLEMFVGGESFDVTAEHCLLLPPRNPPRGERRIYAGPLLFLDSLSSGRQEK